MSLKGRLGGTSHAPYIESRVSLPRLDLHTNVSFLLDTGADSTVLCPSDAKLMQVDLAAITRRTTSLGVGGEAENYVEKALVSFVDGRENLLYVYEIDLEIIEPCEGIETLPSLLGRDIINKWGLRYSPLELIVEATVFDASMIFDSSTNDPIPRDVLPKPTREFGVESSMQTP